MGDNITDKTEAKDGHACADSSCEHDHGKGELPPLDFSTFILSLSTSALMHMGIVENPVTKKKEKELTVAKQTIDLIELLRDKTVNNLADDEKKLMENVLHELKVMYCRAIL